MLHFLNQLDFVGCLESDDYEKLNCIKKVLYCEFQDVNSKKLKIMLGFVDDLYILFITQEFHDLQILTKILRGDIFLLVKEKIEDENFFPLSMLCS